jgi:hypothetical protein
MQFCYRNSTIAKEHYGDHFGNFYARMIGGFTQNRLEQQNLVARSYTEKTEVHREMHLYFLRATLCLLCALRAIGFIPAPTAQFHSRVFFYYLEFLT